MMPRFRHLVRAIAVVFVSAGVSAVAAQSAARAPAPDALMIVGVSPATFADGAKTPVEVTVAYDLSSCDEAVLELCANELRAQGFGVVTSQPIKRGTGTITLAGELVPRFWSAVTPAKIMVNIWREDDSPSRRRTLAADDLPLTGSQPQSAAPGGRAVETPAGSETYDDAIAIKSVAPEVLVAGQETEIVVAVAYALFSRADGEINLGSSAGRTNGYTIVGRTQIKIGQGDAVVRARIVPTRTGRLPFTKLFVNLSEYPHRARWAPLATDSTTLEVR